MVPGKAHALLEDQRQVGLLVAVKQFHLVQRDLSGQEAAVDASHLGRLAQGRGERDGELFPFGDKGGQVVGSLACNRQTAPPGQGVYEPALQSRQVEEGRDQDEGVF